MKKCCKKKVVKNSEMLETVALVDKYVSHKIKNINIVLPILVTIITAILSYLFTAKINAENLKSAVCITICAVVVFAVILWAHLPVITRSVKKTKHKYCKDTFSPANLTQGAYFSDEEYVEQYEKYFQRTLTPTEKVAVSLLKSKINEMRFRTNCLVIVFILLIIGLFITVVLLLLALKGVG